jgi:hypothetical protein
MRSLAFRRAGFSIEETLRTYGVVFAFVYGFVLARTGDDHITQAKQIIDAVGPADYPHALEVTNYFVQRRDYDYAQEFVTGLDLILDGVERSAAGV